MFWGFGLGLSWVFCLGGLFVRVWGCGGLGGLGGLLLFWCVVGGWLDVWVLVLRGWLRVFRFGFSVGCEFCWVDGWLLSMYLNLCFGVGFKFVVVC